MTAVGRVLGCLPGWHCANICKLCSKRVHAHSPAVLHSWLEVCLRTGLELQQCWLQRRVACSRAGMQLPAEVPS